MNHEYYCLPINTLLVIKFDRIRVLLSSPVNEQDIFNLLPLRHFLLPGTH
jgi:hypothetical protein